MAKIGRAAIGWSSTEDANTERIHLLDVPLRDLRAGHTMSAYRAESLDKTAIETFHVGNGAYELVGRVRFDGRPSNLIDLIKAGSQGKTLTYYPNLTDPDVAHACILVAPMSPADLDIDGARAAFGDQEVELRLRKTDETPFPALLEGTNVLFAYRAGDSLAQATFTRADTAHYVGKGLGTLSSAASGKARITWISTAGSTGVRMTPALLLERAQTNRVPWSEKFSTWTSVGSVALTSGQADPKGGTAAWLMTDASSTQLRGKTQAVTLTATSRPGVSIFLKQGTTASTAGVLVQLRATTAAVNRAKVTVTWSSGKPTATINTGSSWVAPEAYRGGWWRIMLRGTTAVSTAQAHLLHIYPGGTTGIGNVGNVYVYGAQVE